jgi:hypothetical protein
MKDSSFIKEMVWDAGNLFVRLKSGKFYEYKNVSEEVYLDFINADSLGTFFGENIKDQYEFIAYVEPEQKTVKGGVANLPKPWNFPTAPAVAAKVLDPSSHWPFPTSRKPG